MPPSTRSGAVPRRAAASRRGPPHVATADPVCRLDHAAYPHLFDVIVAAAPYGSLLVLRGTSKALQERVHIILASHLVIKSGLNTPSAKLLKRAAGYLPAGPTAALKRPAKECINIASVLGQLPGLLCDYGHVRRPKGAKKDWQDSCGEECAAVRSYWEGMFAQYTRTLDVHAPWLDHSTVDGPRDVRPAFAALETVRYSAHPWVSEAARKYKTYPYILTPHIVVFTQPSVINIQETFVDDLPEEIEPIVRRMTVHTTFPDGKSPEDYRALHMLSQSVDTTEWVSEVVLIFEHVADHPASSLSPRISSMMDSGLDTIYHGRATAVALPLVEGATTQFTIVGVDELPYQCLGLKSDMERVERETRMVEDIARIFEESVDDLSPPKVFNTSRNDPPSTDYIRSQLRFMSRAEYIAEVGAERWALETVRGGL